LTPEERLGLAETLRAYTLGSAYAIHAEGNRGRIAPGLYADLIVLSHDLAELSPAEILSQARVELTLVGGRIAHRTGAI
jgi:predicted amidohydrolase YtcJ